MKSLKKDQSERSSTARESEDLKKFNKISMIEIVETFDGPIFASKSEMKPADCSPDGRKILDVQGTRGSYLLDSNN